MVTIEIANDNEFPINAVRLRKAVRSILADALITRGEISIAIVDDATMHDLNRRFLQHDYPTDVLSFALEQEGDLLDGELIVSHEYAAREAARYAWPPDDELLLYAIHGALHLVGYDDLNPAAKREMRAAEAKYLALFGLQGRYDEGE